MDRRLIRAAALLLAPLVAGCSDTESGSADVNRDHGIPIRTGEVHSPGTPLLDGFRVPPGAVLAGAVLQAKEQTGDPDPIPVRSWSATLGIDGPPLDVIHAFADQATAVGLETNGQGGCAAAQAVPPSPARCGLSTTSPVTAAGIRGPQLDVTIETIPNRRAIGYVQFHEWGEPGTVAPPTSSSTLAVPPRFRPEPSVSLPAFSGPAKGKIPEPGQPVGFRIAPIRVQSRSAMVTVAHNAPPGAPQEEALLRVTNGNPESVFREYLTAIKRTMPRLDTAEPTRSAGWIVTTVYFNDGAEDGAGGTAQLFTQSGRAYIRLYLYQG